MRCYFGSLNAAYRLCSRYVFRSTSCNVNNFSSILVNTSNKFSRQLIIHTYNHRGEKNLVTRPDAAGEVTFQNIVALEGENEEIIVVPENGKGRLFPDSDDPHVRTLSHATNAQQVFDWLQEHGHQITVEQATEALATLWELQKAYCHHSKNFSYQSFVRSTIEYSEGIRNHPQFKIITRAVTERGGQLDDNILTHNMLFLRRFGFSPWEESVYPLLLESLERLKNFSLPALSRWTVACRDFHGTGRVLLAQALPGIYDSLALVTTSDELKLVAICLSSVPHLVSDDLAEKFSSLVQRMIKEKTLNSETPLRTLLKVSRVLQTLGNPSCFRSSLDVLRLLEKSAALDNCNTIEIVWLLKQLETSLEPASLVEKAEHHICRFLENADLNLEHLELLAYISQSGNLSRKKFIEEYIDKLFRSSSPVELLPYLSPLYKLIRRIKTCNTKLVDAFWNATGQCINLVDEKEIQRVLIHRSCHWYMYFNNNMGGTYRLKSFENRILTLIRQSWKSYDVLERSSVVCKMIAFAVAYGDSRDYVECLELLRSVESRLDAQDVETLSKGLQIAFSFHRKVPEALAEMAVNLALLLDRRTKDLLNASTSLGDTISLIRAQHLRKFSMREAPNATSELAFVKCQSQMEQLNFRNLRDLLYSLSQNRVLNREMVDSVGAFIQRQRDDLNAAVACKFVILCYELGYLPPQIEHVLPHIADIIVKNSDRVPGLNLVHSCLALILFERLPMEMVRHIFSVPFLEQLDQEVAACYSKASYPSVVRRTLMELNRAVCVDLPEAEVPWFHEKYCREQANSSNQRRTLFHAEISRCLSEVLRGEDNYRTNVYTPYYHPIDFEILLDDKRTPVPQKDLRADKSDYQRIAVQAIPVDAYTSHQRNLTGPYQLRHRQLEVLGYQVLAVPYHQWNSLPLSSLEAKIKYLRQRLRLNL